MKNQIKKISAISPSAGVGARMSSVKAKQYLKIDDLSILEKTVSQFVM